MPKTRNRAVAGGAAALAFLVPSSAFAQSAGDQQYADPFGQTETREPANDRGSRDGEQRRSSRQNRAAPQATSPAPPSGSPASPRAGAASQTLPRTGPDTLALGLLGGALLLAGGLIRRRIAPVAVRYDA